MASTQLRETRVVALLDRAGLSRLVGDVSLK